MANIFILHGNDISAIDEAAAKLAAIGYTNIYEFGGIIDWTGEVTNDN